MKDPTKTISRYLERHAVDIDAGVELPPPADDLKICLVIPAYDELETIAEVIDSVADTEMAPTEVEIIVCVNHGADAPDRVKEANRKTVALLRERDSPFALFVIDRASAGAEFPADQAGVGRARRLLMDLATRRLHQSGHSKDGIIACLDGDSPADPGYLDQIWRELSAHTNALAAHCRYRHPIPDDPHHARAIIAYETWMRHFEVCLHLTGSPYAFQSIGSCMVVTARGYAAADGVPPREALSDFYLLQKIAKVGGNRSVIQLKEPLVRPSPRQSTRVPRGTGPSVRAAMTEEEKRFEWVEPPRAFFEMRHFFKALPEGFENPEILHRAASPFLTEILERWNGFRTIDKLRTHAPDARRFERQVHIWFDSLKVVKFANRSKEKWGPLSIFDAVGQVYRELYGEAVNITDRRELLEKLRGDELRPWL